MPRKSSLPVGLCRYCSQQVEKIEASEEMGNVEVSTSVCIINNDYTQKKIIIIIIIIII